MRHDADQQKLFHRRTALLAGGKLMLLSALVGRMYYLQVLESDKYKTLADENRINLRLLPPPRGRIVDRFGVPLADNQQNYRVVLISEQTPAVEQTLDVLSTIVEIGEAERARILRETRRRRSWVPVTVRENLTWEEVARIEVNTPDLPGVLIDVGQSRDYPHGMTTAHVLGYVAAVNEAEANGDRLLLLPGFRIGKNGIEKTHDLELRGKGGSSQVEVNAYGRMIRELSRQEGQPGAEVRLSIDLEVQRKVSSVLPAESSSSVVLDIRTGDILAMASTPSFDPNAFNRGLTPEEWRGLSQNPMAPLINKAIAGQYAPGSTFKVVVALAALEAGIVGPDTDFYCNGALALGNARFHCWKQGGHGRVVLRDGMKWSCDVYFYEVAKRLGIDRIAAMAERLGLGQTLLEDLPGEQSGLIPTRAWKQKAIGTSWQGGESLVAGIGQGYITTTPLQLAVMTARVASGGLAVLPRLTLQTSAPASEGPGRPPHPLAAVPDPAPFADLGIKPEHIRVVLDAMNAVVNEPRGTAQGARIKEPEMAMGGKTGTSQVRRISKAERDRGVIKNEDLPWERRDHALFIAYAPVQAPRFACSVVVEHGGGGSAVAAPLARDILRFVQERYRSLGAGPTATRSDPVAAGRRSG
jgi:penicillin-binding protein 2